MNLFCVSHTLSQGSSVSGYYLILHYKTQIKHKRKQPVTVALSQDERAPRWAGNTPSLYMADRSSQFPANKK